MSKMIVEIAAVLVAMVLVEWLAGDLTDTRPAYVLVIGYVLIRVAVSAYRRTHPVRRRVPR